MLAAADVDVQQESCNVGGCKGEGERDDHGNFGSVHACQWSASSMRFFVSIRDGQWLWLVVEEGPECKRCPVSRLLKGSRS